MEISRSAREHATEIGEARDRLIELAERCDDAQWGACLRGSEDQRPTGVIIDHVADAYTYMAGWMRAILDGQTPQASAELVDELNARHAVVAASVSREEAIAHLLRQGNAIMDLVRPLRAEDLELGRGRVQRFAEIAIRHADAHRSEIEDALAIQSQNI